MLMMRSRHSLVVTSLPNMVYRWEWYNVGEGWAGAVLWLVISQAASVDR